MDPVLAGCVVHEPGTAPDKSPEEWDTTGWDAGRVGPKSLDEARAALADRIADPTAPDDTTVAGVYDETGGV
jgi:hypothetical protein